MMGKKLSEVSNGTAKPRDQQQTMSFAKKDMGAAAHKNEGKPQNGSFRTDSAISGNKNGGGRTLEPWMPDGPASAADNFLGGLGGSSTGKAWDQFAENERRFGVTTDYDENIYTMPINTSHPQHRQRVAEAERKAKEIEGSAATNSHVLEERITDHAYRPGENGLDEEDKYSGVRRQQDFPPLVSTGGNKYTPPARRAPTGQSTVSGAPVDPAIISSQLARPEKAATSAQSVVKASKELPAATTPGTVAIPQTKAATQVGSESSTNHDLVRPTVSTHVPKNATSTVAVDVALAFKDFAADQRKNAELSRSSKLRQDKDSKLRDLKKFAASFTLKTPVPSDLISIIAKDPLKQKEILEKAERNTKETKLSSPDAAKPATSGTEVKSSQKPSFATHGPTPAGSQARANASRGSTFQSPLRSDRNGQAQPLGYLTQRLRDNERNKYQQRPPTTTGMPTTESRLPPTGPANAVESSFSRRSSTSAQTAKLNPNSSEFKPNANAPSFSPSINPGATGSPRPVATAASIQGLPIPSVKGSLLKRKPLKDGQSSDGAKFMAMGYVKSLKPSEGKNWASNGDVKPAFETPPTWRIPRPEDAEDPKSNMDKEFRGMFETATYSSASTMSPTTAAGIPQVAHQHQLPFHLQHGVNVNMVSRGSPSQRTMNPHQGHHNHGPTASFNGSGNDNHRMMPSHSAQSHAASPNFQHVPVYGTPASGNPQMAYNPAFGPYNAPQMQGNRSLSQTHYLPNPNQMPNMMHSPNQSFMNTTFPPMMYPPPGPFVPNGQPPMMPGYSPRAGGAPLMMSSGSQQGQQQHMFGIVPGQQYGNAPHMGYPQPGPPSQMPMRGYPTQGPNHFPASPQQQHLNHFAGPPQHRNFHNGNHSKNFQAHGQQPNGPQGNQIPTGPQAQASGSVEEAK